MPGRAPMPEEPNNDRTRGLVLALGIACAALPAMAAIARGANVADAAHDVAVVRDVGFGWTGGWRAIEVAWAGAFAWLPLGTRVFRAAMASAVAAGGAGALLYVATRAWLATVADAPRFGALVAAIGSLAATMGIAWQVEAQAAGGATLGALLVLAPLGILAAKYVQNARVALASLAIGLAASFEPTAGVAALAGAAACVVAEGEIGAWKAEWRRAAIGFAVGLAPFAIAASRAARVQGAWLSVGAFANAIGERGIATQGAATILQGEIGWLSGALAIAGVALSVLEKKARAHVAGFLAIAIVSYAASALGVATGPTRYASVVLAGIAAVYAASAIGMQACVLSVARLKIPYAKASATMIALLEMAIVARVADDAGIRCAERARSVTATWDAVAWRPIAPGSIVLVGDRAVELRLLAARAEGELPDDLAIVPTFDLRGPLASRELSRESKLEAFWRDQALLGSPGEWSLSSLASTRPLAITFDPTWERSLARHYVPVGLFARFEAEPRGASDRRRALDEITPLRERLAHMILTPPDAELVSVTTTLLRARAISLAASGERDLLGRALDELRPFSPADPVAMELVKRTAGTRGAIDVTGLAP